MVNILISLYNLAWLAALPFLRRSSRIAIGWPQRTLKDVADGPFDLWIQAASGGEALLTNMVLERLAESLPDKKIIRILVTSGTKEGIDSLVKGSKQHITDSKFDITVAYFPFDAPHYMEKAFALFAPTVAVIIETELWPGFLIAAKRKNVPVLLINGRMSEKSFGSYKYLGKFFKKYGPNTVLAISPLDGERFSQVIGSEKVFLMNNIKFDRIEPVEDVSTSTPIATLVPLGTPFILLGSIRKEEEEKILTAIAEILANRSDIIIGLFPKHVERANHWIKRLREIQIDAIKRSNTSAFQLPGTVIVWDVFGELAGAYALADATFVGGSLINLGGQNFLEPLIFGLRPIIGPYWKNFAWVGREIVETGLVHEIRDENQLVTKLLDVIDTNESRDVVINHVQTFFKSRKGGTHQVCQVIIENLHSTEK